MHKKLWLTITVTLGVLLINPGCTPPATITTTVTVPATTVVVTVPASSSALPTPLQQPAIVIAYTPTFSLTPSAGNLLVVDATIENRGYTSFNTNPAHFSAVVTNLPYPCDVAASDLKTVDLLDGGTISGKLAFPVPAGAASSRVGYNLAYSGTQVYNIQWIRRGG